MRVINKIDTIKFAFDEVKSLAKGCSCLKFNNRHGDYILYDKFLLAVRGATMSKDEIKM